MRNGITSAQNEKVLPGPQKFISCCGIQRRWIRRISWAVAFGGLSFLIVCGVIGGRLVAPVNRKVGAAPESLELTSTEIASQSGSMLATWFTDVPQSKGVIVLLHPIRGNRRSMLGRAELFIGNGYSVVMIDFQAHGESPGDHLTIGYLERLDAVAAVEFAQLKYPGKPVAIVGWSLGGAAAILASPITGVDVIVLESVYPSLSEAVNNRLAIHLGPFSHLVSPFLVAQMPMRLGISANDLRPIDAIKNVPCPVLILAGDQDRHTTIDESYQMFAAANSPKEIIVFENAEHTDLLAFDRALYSHEVLDFLNEHLNQQR